MSSETIALFVGVIIGGVIETVVSVYLSKR